MSVSITWHGHATLSLDVDGKKVLIDPFISDNPSCSLDESKAHADYILITHGHGDHVGDSIEIAKRTGALVISNFEICNWVIAQGHDNVHAQHIGGAYEHPFGRVKLTIAFHGSALPDGSYGGMAAGFLLHVGGIVIYVAGDTALYSDMQLIGKVGLDMAVVPIGDNFTMGPDDALQAVKFLQPKVVMPYHCNTWDPIVQDVPAWANRVKNETDVDVIVPEIDKSYLVS